jgi:hypothetical protein
MTKEQIYKGFELLKLNPVKNDNHSFYFDKSPFEKPSILKDVSINISASTLLKK